LPAASAPATGSPRRDCRLLRVSPAVQSVYLHQQGAIRRLARDSTDPALRDSLLRLADEYAARASAQETDTAARQAGPLDQDGD